MTKDRQLIPTKQETHSTFTAYYRNNPKVLAKFFISTSRDGYRTELRYHKSLDNKIRIARQTGNNNKQPRKKLTASQIQKADNLL